MISAAETTPPSTAVPSRPVAWFVTGLLRLWCRTLRYRWEGDANQLEATRQGPCIYALWHGNQLPLLPPFAASTRVILVSLSRDGSLLDAVVRRLGYQTVRGSSSRNGREALENLRKAASEGLSPVLAVDGPRGPRAVPHAGVARLALDSGLPILPVGVWGRGLRLKTWDRFCIPLPFSSWVIRRGTPLVPKPGDTVEGLLAELQRRLNHLETTAPGEETTRMTGSLVSGDNPLPNSLILRCFLVLLSVFDPLISVVWKGCLRLFPRLRPHGLERLGLLESPPRGRIWIHGASLGEQKLARRVAAALTALGEEVVLTCTSTTARIQDSGPYPLYHLPMDLPSSVERTLKTLQPRGLILLETELWPVLLHAVRQRNLPLLLLNGRISPQRFHATLRLRPLLASSLSNACVAARTEGDLERLRALGASASTSRVTGDLKCVVPDGLPVPAPELLHWIAGRPLVIGASLHPGEQQLFLQLVEALQPEFPQFAWILAPRHLSSLDSLPSFISVRSSLSVKTLPSGLLLLDSHGELPALFPLACLTILGGTFVPVGGHNLYEPVGAGVCTVVGPHTDQLTEALAVIEPTGAVSRVERAEALVDEVRRRLSQPEQLRAQGRAGQLRLLEVGMTELQLLTVLQEWCAGIQPQSSLEEPRV